jgi:hypothetical protein
LDILNRGAWCVIVDRTSRVLSWIEIGAMPDWRIRFAEMIQAAVAAGWALEQERPDYSNFYCQRSGTRISATLQPSPPGNPLDDWPLPAPAPSIQDCFKLPGVPTTRARKQ